MLIFLIILGFSNCNQEKKSVTPTHPDEPHQNSNFYKRFEGTIAGQPVVMQLHKTNENFSGNYYYRNTGGWLSINADTIFSDSIILNEFAEAYNENTYDEANKPQLRCKLENDVLTGSWISADKKTSYPINLKESYPQGAYKFFIEDYADSTKAFPAVKESPSAELRYTFVSAENNKWLNGEIKKIINYDSTLNFKDGYNKIKTEYFSAYKKEFPVTADSVSMQETSNHSLSQNLTVRFNENNFVILEASEYNYSGGMHGNYGSYFHCYDMVTKKQLILSDIISADSMILQHEVEKHFALQYKLKDSLNEILFENYLPANSNFYFNEKGITFLYNPYEVASYTQGEISVFIPFTALKKYLQLEFRKRMHLNL